MRDLQMLYETAARRHGVVTRSQAADLGFSRHAVAHQLAANHWQLARRGVYRVAGTVRSWEQDMTALLACVGPGAVASHRSAAALLGLPGFRRDLLEVTTPRDRRHRAFPDAVVHRSRLLPKHHLTVIEGIATTRVARTLVDLAAVVHPRRAARALDNALSTGLVTPEGLEAVIGDVARRGRTGIRLLRELVAERNDGEPVPQSELEARFVRIIREAGLPTPVRQLDVGDDEEWVGRADFAYPQARLLIELDGRRHHTALLDWERDLGRGNRLIAGGWRLLRITWRELADHPDRVVELVRRALADVPGSGNE